MPIQFRYLPPLPQAAAGQFVGAVGDTLVVAGGTWWTSPPAAGGRKIWMDTIHTLDRGAARWRDAGRLPSAVSYGGAVSTGKSIILAGGQTAESASPIALRLTLQDGRVRVSLLPNLPQPAANLAAAAANGRMYVVGGQRAPDAAEAAASVWSLDLARPDRWREEPRLPGEGRILPAAAACGNDLYVMGGAALYRASSGTVARRYLRDAFRFRPGAGWTRIADLPAPSVAAPAVCGPGRRPLLFGGDDGGMVGVSFPPGQRHPGFSKSVLAYDPVSDRWQPAGDMPDALVTTGAAMLAGAIVICGGEDRPGSRSAAVLELRFPGGNQP
jgi:N-acetylneuraminate epimerase